jgi:hypothetical protein
MPSGSPLRMTGGGVALIVAIALATACSSESSPTPTLASAPPQATSARPTPSPATELKPIATVTPLPPSDATQDELNRARLLMLQSFDFRIGANVVAIQQAGELGVQESIIPLIELSRFVFEDYTITELGTVLQNLTGQPFGGSEWAKWYRWLGEHPELKPLQGYTTWKGDLYSQIDPRFATFFEESQDTRIPMWGIQWGGVPLDGIPPLENPRVIRGDEAGYLRLDDPVFGAVVNGEARAYPWRHMASHELANDTIQGRPVTVVF